jgi:hypothetical protein
MDSQTNPANSNGSLKADASKGCKLLSTGSSGKIKSSGSLFQVTLGRIPWAGGEEIAVIVVTFHKIDE